MLYINRGNTLSKLPNLKAVMLPLGVPSLIKLPISKISFIVIKINYKIKIYFKNLRKLFAGKNFF